MGKRTTTRTAAWLMVLAVACAFVALSFAIGPVSAQATATQAFIQQLHLARAGRLSAQLFVAKAFAEGVIVEKNMQQAVGWYTRAAKKGDFEAQFQAAKILHAGGDGVKRQPLAAVKLYKAAAKRGHPGAQNWLGYAYQHGHGVVKDYTIAADWYQNSAEQGLADAQNNLALLHLVGNGVNQDHPKAVELFQKAVDQGHGFAMNNLAGMYEIGWGVARDGEKAKELYRSAAIAGNTSAIENLKRLGVPIPPEAQQRIQQKSRASLTPALGTGAEPNDTDDVLNRGDVVSEVPSLEATDEEFEQWLAEQEDGLDDDFNSSTSSSSDPFDFVRKNWNRVNRQRNRRRKGPSETLR